MNDFQMYEAGRKEAQTPQMKLWDVYYYDTFQGQVYGTSQEHALAVARNTYQGGQFALKVFPAKEVIDA